MKRCGICGHHQGLVPAKRPEVSQHEWYCRNSIACNYRARLRLGIPRWRANELRAEERNA